MDPSGHHHHHHHHHPEPEPGFGFAEENPYPTPAHHPYGYAPPPPPTQPHYGDAPPPPPNFQHVYHGHQPPAFAHVAHEPGYGGGYAPPPPAVQHVGHEVGGYGPGYANQVDQHHHGPSFFPHAEHVRHESGPSEVTRLPTVRIYTKAEEGYSLSIREGQVVLVPANHLDDYQHWIKDLRYSTKVKDEEGFPSFALVNKVTGQAIKHSIGATHPVRLIKYNPDYLDESVLWTESKDLGDGFRCIRMVNNIRLNFDAFHGDEDHGGVRDGTTLVLWEWLKGKNQRWKIVPY